MISALPILDTSSHGVALRVSGPENLIPSRAPEPGEQYRFHFDVSKCIGCKCCVVACQEQNAVPAALSWRKVGELESGIFPDARRWHLSMGCNHCIEPSCQIGCPVDAYSKQTDTGIVTHSAEQCIGCQYCTWNCSYGVPQYDQSRGVVAKCDLCQERLHQGDSPACVNACPEGAIAVEIVDVAAWRANHAAADAPGLPPSHHSLSTTRITLPTHTAPMARVDLDRIELAPAHWPLVGLLALVPTGCALLASTTPNSVQSAMGLALLLLGMALCPLHLGKPAYAWRAWIGWRHSWLSREVIAFSALAPVAVLTFLGHIPHPLLGVLSALALACSAQIYRVPAQPAWNSWRTTADFLRSGPLVISLAFAPMALACSGLGLTALLEGERYFWLANHHEWPAQRSVKLLRSQRLLIVARWILLVTALGAHALDLPWYQPLLLALSSEAVNRYLFFVTAAGHNSAGTFLTPGDRQ